MPWSGLRQTRVAHSACDSTIGQSRRGKRSLRRVCNRIEFENCAEDVVLVLTEGGIAHANRTRTRVTRQVVARRFRQLATAVNAVHDLQRAILCRLDVGDELHELVRFRVQFKPVECLEHESRITHPRVAVVPVALSTGCLWEGGGESRDRRAGRHKGQPFDGERRALDGGAVVVVGNAGPSEPRTPIASRGRNSRLGLVGVLRCGESFGPGERTIRPVARPQDVVRPHAVTLDPQREIRAEADRLPRTARVGCMAVAADRSPFRRHAAVVEGRFADEFDLDPAFEAEDRSHEQMVGVVVCGRPGVRCDLVLVIPGADRQRVADKNPAGRRFPGRDQDVRARLVDPRCRVVDPEGPEAKTSGLPVEQAAEHARRVEAGHAEPVDRSIRGHERAGVAVGQERVIGDRRERRGCGRTLLPEVSGLPAGRRSVSGGAHICHPGSTR